MATENKEISNLRKNVICWYPFKENSNIFEIWEGQETTEIDNEKYDYIAIIGIGEKDLKDLIKEAELKLNPEGILLIAIDNKIGIESLCTEKEKQSKKINKSYLIKLLNDSGLINQKFYYPMPHYRTTNVIFSDDCLPNFETLNRSITLYDDNTLIALEEKKRLQAIIEEEPKLFKELASSFLVECSKSDLENHKISFVSFSNIRKE